MPDTKTVIHAAMGVEAIMEFVQRFHDAPAGANIEIGICMPTVPGPCHVIINMEGKSTAMRIEEADKLAALFEEAMNECPDDPEGETLPDLIMGLRTGAECARSYTHGLN